ncbi:MAG: DUF1684 domain-containing protein [Gemmatimonadaceae bacterium]|nr:DUF1684 domain-containing protein [Gemmatimonadaceae bacterium]
MAVAAVGAVAAAACTRLPEAPPIDPAQHHAQWDAWRMGRDAATRAPGGPLSFTGLSWLPRARAVTVGSDTTHPVRLAGDGVPAMVGTLVRGAVSRDSVVDFISADTTRVWVDGAHPSRARLLTDVARATSRVEVGSAGFRLIHRGDSVGVRTWNVQHPALATFAGLDTFPLDPQWRVGARFEPYRRPRVVRVMTEAGVEAEQTALGELRFTLDGSSRRLVAWAKPTDRELFVVFKDRTSGIETYGFRYLRVPRDAQAVKDARAGERPREETLVVDFNYAYNPDCAFTRFATCPLPPRQNVLPARITAGERVFHLPKEGVAP